MPLLLVALRLPFLLQRLLSSLLLHIPLRVLVLRRHVTPLGLWKSQTSSRSRRFVSASRFIPRLSGRPARLHLQHRQAPGTNGALIKHFPAAIVSIVSWRTLTPRTPDLLRELRRFRIHAPSRSAQARCPRTGKLRSLPATDDRRATEGARHKPTRDNAPRLPSALEAGCEEGQRARRLRRAQHVPGLRTGSHLTATLPRQSGPTTPRVTNE